MGECLHTQIGRAHVHACTRDARTHARVRGWCCACYVGLRPRHARKIGVSPHLIDKYIRCETDDLAHFVRSRLPATLVNGAPSLAGRSLGFLYWYNTRKAPFGAFLTICTNPLPAYTRQD
nr:MAG TPA: hypothetical protein [Microviridae sp.]